MINPTDKDIAMLLEHSGYISSASETVDIADVLTYVCEGNAYQLVEEFVEIDGEMYVPIQEMSDVLFESFKGNIDPIKEIEIEGTYFTLTETLRLEGDEVFVLIESAEEVIEEDDTFEFDGKEYCIVAEEDATSFAYVVEEGDDYLVVDEADDADSVVYLREVE